MEFPKRKATRLKEYDYSQNGCYFITVCTGNRRQFLSQIVGQGLAPAEIKLSEYGEIAKEQLLALEERYTNVKIDNYAIMPNHIHAIIRIDTPADVKAGTCPGLSDVMCAFKSISARKIRHAGYKETVFQASYYDHIVRNERDYREIWAYIDGNASKWNDDELNR